MGQGVSITPNLIIVWHGMPRPLAIMGKAAFGLDVSDCRVRVRDREDPHPPIRDRVFGGELCGAKSPHNVYGFNVFIFAFASTEEIGLEEPVDAVRDCGSSRTSSRSSPRPRARSSISDWQALLHHHHRHPFGLQAFKLAGLSLWPVGRRVVTIEVARAARD